MISIDNCSVEKFGTGFKAVANDGFVLYRVDRFEAWKEYCRQHEEHPIKYPEITLFDFMTFSRVVYFPANADGSNYKTMAEESGMRVNGVVM